MTSKISFFNLCRENLRRFTVSIMVTLFYYLFQIIWFVIELQNKLSFKSSTKTDMLLSINALSEPDFFIACFGMVLAVSLAFSGFRFLHSKTQTDFYDSLPMKRNTMFRIIAVNSFLIFTIPLVVSTVIEFLILTVVGYGNATALYNLLWSMLCMLVSFVAVWVTCALALIMTGHTIVALLGLGVFGSYFPIVLRYLIPSYANTFFEHYRNNSAFFSKLTYFSPFTLIYKLTVDYRTWTFARHYKFFWMSIIWTLVIGIIAYILYLKRPSEAAGRAMAFEKVNPVIRFLLVVPMTLYAGVYLHELSLQSAKIWLFIGIITGAFIFHGIVECIYQFDIRGMFSHKKQLGVTIAICFAFTAVFLTDVTGYDNYIPKKSDLDSIVIGFSEYYNDTTYSSLNFKKDGVSGENMDPVLALIQDAVNQDLPSDDDDPNTITVTYNLKNGRTKERSYTFNPTNEAELMDQIFATEDFKNDFYALYKTDRSKICGLTWAGFTETMNLDLSGKELDEFLDTYLDDLSSLTYTQMTQESPICELDVDYTGTTVSTEYYDIYPSFTNTLAFLQKHGIPTAAKLDDLYNITKLTVDVYDDDYETMERKVITDSDAIHSVSDNLIVAAFVNYPLTNYNDHYQITASLERDGVTGSTMFYISNDGLENLQKILDNQ